MMERTLYVLVGERSAVRPMAACFIDRGVPELVRYTARRQAADEVDGLDAHFRDERELSLIDFVLFDPMAAHCGGFGAESLRALTNRNRSFFVHATLDEADRLSAELTGYAMMLIVLDDSYDAMKLHASAIGDMIMLLDKSTDMPYADMVNEWLSEPRTKTAYISGKMSGLADYGRGKFARAKAYLHGQGYEVFSPADIGVVAGWEWADYMRYDAARLMQCDEVFMLDDWRDSKGATIEYELADALGIPVSFVPMTVLYDGVVSE